jgi:serine/threonine protein phosphatase PrpC
MAQGQGTASDLMKAILLTAAGNPENQDRGLILEDGPRTVLCVADGAGGRSGGGEAAGMAVEFVRQNTSILGNPESCAEVLRKMDTVVANDSIAGETTCALAIVTPEEVLGASVGDSGVWLIPDDEPYTDLTQAQRRKPMVGSACAWPVPFRRLKRAGVLLLATDGLMKYTSAQRIVETCKRHPIEPAAQRLIELVRYPSGSLPDDVTLILASL